MANKDTVPKAKPDKKTASSQKERFIEAARNAEADETGEAFSRAVGSILRPRTNKQ